MTSCAHEAHPEQPALLQHVTFSTRADGDFHLDDVPRDDLDRRRRALVDLPWSQPDEVHGTRVLEVTEPGEHDGAVADALVTRRAGAVLGIWTGDCAPVALFGEAGVIGAVHAGWRGLRDGVLEAAVTAMRRLGSGSVHAVLGPCIHPCCYEFGAADLAAMTDRFGASVLGRTRDGRPALDVPAAVEAALARLDVPLARASACTGCAGGRWYSHRVRGERGRQIMAVWQAVAA